MLERKPLVLESEAGFRVLFQCATIGILVVSEQGRIELSNPCAGKLFEYDPEELVGKPLEILIPEHLKDKHVRHREAWFQKPKSRPMGAGIELFARKKGGDVFPVEISLAHYELDGEKLAVAFITDVSAQARAKQLVADREAWFRNMADNSPVMIWVAGPDKLCTYFNKTWIQFTGRTLEKEMGAGWTEGIHSDDVGRYFATYNDAFDSRRAFYIEYRLKRNDGTYRWMECVGKPTYSDHEFAGYVGSCSDIHDQRMMKQELEAVVRRRTTELYEALDREKEMNELKSRFVSMASHEFRTPLSIVLSSTTLIEQYGVGENDERIRKHLVRIKSSIGNLTNILNDFLSLDKLDQGKVEIEHEAFDMTEFMSEVAGEVNILLKKGQAITTEHRGDRLVVLDQKKLRYILVNLVSNSVKYSPQDSEVRVVSENRNRSVVVIVEDHGIGIPEEEQQYMYTKFFRAKNTASIQGTGLGLTIVKRYVELMKGRISFSSKAGIGTTFIVELPKA